MLGMVVAAALEGFTATLRRALLRQKLLAATAVIVLIALVWLSIAADLWLVPRCGAAAAAALTGGGLLVLAGALVLIAGSLRSARTPVIPALALDAELRPLAQPLAIAALIAGFVLAQRPRGDSDKE